MDEWNALLPYCLGDQERKVRTIIECGGNIKRAAEVLGIGLRNMRHTVAALRKRAALSGYMPELGITSALPAPFVADRVTVGIKDVDGNRHWLKGKVDQAARAELLREWAESLGDAVKPLPPIKAPKDYNKDLLAVIPLGDPHFGMLAWAKECGESFDLADAERLTRGAIDYLVDNGPAAETCLVINTGDLFHANDGTNKTPGHGNPLDVDGRTDKILFAAYDCFSYCLERLAQKHKRVIFWNVPGNHDPDIAKAFTVILHAHFRKTSRVEVCTKPGKFKYMQWGKVLIASTHGDQAKPDDLASIMATDCPQEWGGTEYRYWYTGHLHHKRIQEYRGCIVEVCRTLAGRDAWHTGMGYRAGRDLQMIVHHRNYGESIRIRCDVARLREAA